MESNGLRKAQSIFEKLCLFFNYVKVPFSFVALRIHISPELKQELDKFGTFNVDLRGPVEMKVMEFVYIFVNW